LRLSARSGEDTRNLRRRGLFVSPLAVTLALPALSSSIPTFDKHRKRSPSPMLRERFRLAGGIVLGTDNWLDPAGMAQALRSPKLRAMHKSFRDHWQQSAPATFDDASLGLFGLSLDVPDSITYLVWKEGIAEPELWLYSGTESAEFGAICKSCGSDRQLKRLFSVHPRTELL
jgi:hypothetical protein